MPCISGQHEKRRPKVGASLLQKYVKSVLLQLPALFNSTNTLHVTQTHLAAQGA